MSTHGTRSRAIRTAAAGTVAFTVAAAAVALTVAAVPAQARVLDKTLPVQACQERTVKWGAYSTDPSVQVEYVRTIEAQLKKVTSASAGRYTFEYIPGTHAWNHSPGDAVDLQRINFTRFTKDAQLMFILAPQAPHYVDDDHLTVEDSRIGVTRQDEARMSADGQAVWLNMNNIITTSLGWWEGKEFLDKLPGRPSAKIRAKLLIRERTAGVLEGILGGLGIERTNSGLPSLTPTEISEIRSQAKESCELVAAHPELSIYSPIVTIDSNGDVGTDREPPFG